MGSKGKEEAQKVFVDDSSTRQGNGVCILLISPQGDEIKMVVQLSFKASNNEIEYKALLTGL